MDQDDEWYPDKLEVQVEAFRQFPDAVMVATDAEKIDDTGLIIDESFVQSPNKKYELLRPSATIGPTDYFRDIQDQIHLTGWFLLPSAVLIDREATIASGMFDERIVLSEDVACFLRLFMRGPLVFVRRPLTRWRIHDTNTHKDVLRMLRGSLCLSRDAHERPGTYPAGYHRRLADEMTTLIRDLGKLELESGDFRQGRRLLVESLSSAPNPRSVVLLVASLLGKSAYRALLATVRSGRTLIRR
jgi:hypothetical protein